MKTVNPSVRKKKTRRIGTPDARFGLQDFQPLRCNLFQKWQNEEALDLTAWPARKWPIDEAHS